MNGHEYKKHCGGPNCTHAHIQVLTIQGKKKINMKFIYSTKFNTVCFIFIFILIFFFFCDQENRTYLRKTK